LTPLKPLNALNGNTNVTANIGYDKQLFPNNQKTHATSVVGNRGAGILGNGLNTLPIEQRNSYVAPYQNSSREGGRNGIGSRESLGKGSGLGQSGNMGGALGGTGGLGNMNSIDSLYKRRY
jgi:hypothetical protein